MKTKQVLEILKVVAWILFIGLCIKTGAVLFSFLRSLFASSTGTDDIYSGMDLSQLHAFSQWHYIVTVSLIVLLSGLKAWLFYAVIKITSKVNVAHPFTGEIANLISKISGIALQIGITAFLLNSYTSWLMKNTIHFTYDAGETGFLFLAGILFVVAQIFKRGIELQSENELTI